MVKTHHIHLKTITYRLRINIFSWCSCKHWLCDVCDAYMLTKLVLCVLSNQNDEKYYYGFQYKHVVLVRRLLLLLLHYTKYNNNKPSFLLLLSYKWINLEWFVWRRRWDTSSYKRKLKFRSHICKVKGFTQPYIFYINLNFASVHFNNSLTCKLKRFSYLKLVYDVLREWVSVLSLLLLFFCQYDMQTNILFTS